MRTTEVIMPRPATIYNPAPAETFEQFRARVTAHMRPAAPIAARCGWCGDSGVMVLDKAEWPCSCGGVR